MTEKKETTQTALEAAEDNYNKAAARYGHVVKKVLPMDASGADMVKHTEECKKALIEKREAYDTLVKAQQGK